MTKKELNRRALIVKRSRALADVDTADLLLSLERYLEFSSAKNLAYSMGVSASYLSDIKNGKREIGDACLMKIIEATAK